MSLLDSWRRQLARELKKRDDAEREIARLRKKIAAAERRR
jgi:type VI protein secretion system component VasF